MHKNQDKQFLKIPVNWVDISYEHRNIYIAYLWVKRYSRFGRVHKRHLPKSHFWHWISKLISVGFMSKEGDYYVLKGYEKVWGLLGIQKVNFRKSKKYRFYKVLEASSWALFKKKMIKEILGNQTSRKIKQLRRYNNGGMSTDVSFSPLSSETVAKLFGYRSRTSGNKYRAEMFEVVKEPLVRRLLLTSDELPYFKFDCKKVKLKYVYKD